MSALPGHCLCGAVSVSIARPDKQVELCQCAMCRRWGGGYYAGIRGKDAEILGAESVTTYRSSEWAERAFCKTCGSNLWFTFLPTGHRSFCAGLFDDLTNAEIEKEIFCDTATAWSATRGDHKRQTGAEVIAEAEAAGFTFD